MIETEHSHSETLRIQIWGFENSGQAESCNVDVRIAQKHRRCRVPSAVCTILSTRPMSLLAEVQGACTPWYSPHRYDTSTEPVNFGRFFPDERRAARKRANFNILSENRVSCQPKIRF